MATTPPQRDQRIIPYLYYEDGLAAIEFLCKAFGFEERIVMLNGEGGVMHAEVGYEDNVVMLGCPAAEPGAPHRRDLPVRHGGVMCYVDDVDAHYAGAIAAGATIVSELEDKPYGDRMYTATDPEGHDWFFGTHVRDVALEDMKPPESE